MAKMMAKGVRECEPPSMDDVAKCTEPTVCDRLRILHKRLVDTRQLLQGALAAIRGPQPCNDDSASPQDNSLSNVLGNCEGEAEELERISSWLSDIIGQ